MFFSFCCCRVFAIVIYNDNAQRDDNFKVLMNGLDIGHIDNDQNGVRTGRIFSDHPTEFTPALIQVPQPNGFETTLAFNSGPDGPLSISNTMRIESIQNNRNGNAGTVLVGYWKKNLSGKYEPDGALLVNATYNMPQGVGNGQDYTFTFP